MSLEGWTFMPAPTFMESVRICGVCERALYADVRECTQCGAHVYSPPESLLTVPAPEDLRTRPAVLLPLETKEK